MKKHIVIMVTLLCLCLSACAAGDSVEVSDSSSFSSLSDRENEPVSITVSPIYYSSFDDLKNSISKGKEEVLYSNIIEAGVPSDRLNEVKPFIDKLQTEGIIVPYLKGKAVVLRNRQGYANISFFASEAYRLPWIFYYPEVSTGGNFFIKIAYLPEDMIDSQKKLTASEVIKKLSPNSPNVNNMGKQHKSIYEQTVKLEDREVVALVIEYNNDSRNSTFFIYDNMLVEVRSDPEEWSVEWFSALSFKTLA